MSIDAMKQALEALQHCLHYAQTHLQHFDAAYNRHPSAENERGVITDDIEDAFAALTALRAAIEQAQGLAEKIPAKGTLLEQTLGKVWDEMPHTALMDALVGGTGVMLGDKRIDPASIYKQPEQEPVAWMYHGIRHDGTPHERPSLIWKPEYMDVMSAEKGAKATPLYTAPRQWQSLTEEEIARREKVKPILVRIMQEAYDLADRDDSEGYNSVKVMCSDVLAMINRLLDERQWQGLTDDDIAQAMYRADAIITGPMQFKFAREIEAKLKEKNT